MPDELAKIGLDATDINKSIDSINSRLEVLGRASQRTDSKINTFAQTLKKIGAATVAITGLSRMVSIMRNYGDEVERARENQVAGTQAAKNFDEATSVAGERQLTWAKRMTNQLDNIKTWFKGTTIDLAMKAAGALGAETPSDPKSATSHASVLNMEDELVSLKETSLTTEKERIKILEKERDVELQKIAFYSQEAHLDRIRLNSARERAQSLYNEIRLSQKSFDLSERTAKAERIHLLATRIGHEHLASEQKISAEFEERIAKARADGREELASSLTIQKRIALEDEKVAQKNQKPQERREARREARIRTSDLTKQAAREEEFRLRTWRGIRGEKGSRLWEWQNRPKDEGPKLPPVGPLDLLKELQKISTNTKGNLVVKAG